MESSKWVVERNDLGPKPVYVSVASGGDIHWVETIEDAMPHVSQAAADDWIKLHLKPKPDSPYISTRYKPD